MTISSLLEKLTVSDLRYILDNLFLSRSGSKSELLDRIIVGSDDEEQIVRCMGKEALIKYADFLRIDTTGSRDMLQDRILRFFNDNFYPSIMEKDVQEGSFIETEDLLYMINMKHLRKICHNLGIKPARKKDDIIHEIIAFSRDDMIIILKNCDREILESLCRDLEINDKESYPILFENIVDFLNGEYIEEINEEDLEDLYEIDDDDEIFEDLDSLFEDMDDDDDDDEIDSLANLLDQNQNIDENKMKLEDMREELSDLLDILTVEELNEALDNLRDSKSGNKTQKIERIVDLCSSNPSILLMNLSTNALDELLFEFGLDDEIPRHLMIKLLTRMIHEEVFGEYDPFFFEDIY